MMFAPLTQRERRCIVVLLVVVVGVRLVTLGAYPLLDPTEARYADLARRMLESGNWLVPRMDFGIPFWAKPPLSMWLSAASMGLLGVSEFAARLPAFLLLLACGALVFHLAWSRSGRDAALWATTIFATTGLTFVSAGAVMTDPALVLGTTLSLAGFWLALSGAPTKRRWWGAIFFAGLAIGLLAKGPIAAVLTLLPIGAWTLWNRNWRDVWRGLPWIAGSLATAALVAPWYWAAERAAPGFLAYFILGEHWQRFVVRGWLGDLYGAAHAWPRGMIWIMWLYAILPWSGLPAGWIFWSRARQRHNARRVVRDEWCSYILFWMLAPLLFFTLSRNVLTTYLLPGLPAFALLLTEFWHPRAQDPRPLRPVVVLLLAGGIGLLVVFGTLLALQDRFLSALSGRALVQRYEALRTGADETLVFVGRRPASAEFYSHGTAAKVADAADLAALQTSGRVHFFAVPASDLHGPPDLVPPAWEPLGAFGEYALFRAPARGSRER